MTSSSHQKLQAQRQPIDASHVSGRAKEKCRAEEGKHTKRRADAIKTSGLVGAAHLLEAGGIAHLALAVLLVLARGEGVGADAALLGKLRTTLLRWREGPPRDHGGQEGGDEDVAELHGGCWEW